MESARHSPPQTSTAEPGKQSAAETDDSKPIIKKVGPAGYLSIHTWDDKGRTAIAGILISYSSSYVHCIQLQYIDSDGKLQLTNLHGDKYPSSPKFDSVSLDYPKENITSITGWYDTFAVVSVKFGTNKGAYVPFGQSDERLRSGVQEFGFKFTPTCQFGGLYGSWNDRGITSIGVYVKLATRHQANNDVFRGRLFTTLVSRLSSRLHLKSSRLLT